jgi:hypothetical protein
MATIPPPGDSHPDAAVVGGGEAIWPAGGRLGERPPLGEVAVRFES